MVAEGGPRGLDGGRELGFVEGLLGRRDVLLGNYVVDRLFHFLLSFIYNSRHSNMLHFSGGGEKGERRETRRIINYLGHMVTTKGKKG